MKKYFILTVILQIWVLQTIAQNFSTEFGKISQADIDLKQYKDDKSAEAIVLFDYGLSNFIEEPKAFNIVFERTTRIKVLTDAGTKWGEIEIPIYHEDEIYEQVYDVEAYTYNYENGVMTKTAFDKRNIFTEKVNNRWSVEKIAMPNVKAGSIIEYKYKLYTQYKFNLRDWDFQWRIPVVLSEYEVHMIPFYQYSWLLQGTNRLDKYEELKSTSERDFGTSQLGRPNGYKDMIYVFGMKNVPAFRDESHITSINDYVIKIDFQLSRINTLTGSKIDIRTTWPDMVKELDKKAEFGKYITKSTSFLKKIPELSNANTLPEAERFNLVLDYVKDNFTWDRSTDKYAHKKPAEFFKEKRGNSAEINLFTIGLLRGLNIEAKPVTISTRSHGKIKFDYPFSHFMNHVIILTKLQDKEFLSDATTTTCSNYRIPQYCINDRGLIIEGKEANWVELESNMLSETYNYIQLEPTKKEFTGKYKLLANNYFADYYREKLGSKKENIEKALKNNTYQLLDSTIVTEASAQRNKPYKLEFKIITTPEIIHDKIYINPFLNETISENPFKQTKRNYPIDFTFPQKIIYISSIIIPEGYQVDYLPEDLSIKNDLFLLSYSSTIEDNTINISFYYQLTKPVYPSKDYIRLKLFYNRLIEKGTDKIVLAPTETEKNIETTTN